MKYLKEYKNLFNLDLGDILINLQTGDIYIFKMNISDNYISVLKIGYIQENNIINIKISNKLSIVHRFSVLDTIERKIEILSKISNKDNNIIKKLIGIDILELNKKTILKYISNKYNI